MTGRAHKGLPERMAECTHLVTETRVLMERFTTGKPVTMEVTNLLADLLTHRINEFGL